jgi:HEAT repeat protein
MTIIVLWAALAAIVCVAPPPSSAEPSMSAAFERFQYSFFKDPTSAQDGLDTASLASIAGAERTQAETLLIDFLPDSRAVIGLGVLRSKKAEPLLIPLFDHDLKEHAEAVRDAQKLPDYNPLRLVFLARALWLIDPDPRWQNAAIEVLASGYYWMHRQEAAEALSAMHTPKAVKALTRALDDQEPPVRFSSARALLAIYGVEYDPKDVQSMVYRVMAHDAARRASGKRDVLAAIAGKAMVGR